MDLRRRLAISASGDVVFMYEFSGGMVHAIMWPNNKSSSLTLYGWIAASADTPVKSDEITST